VGWRQTISRSCFIDAIDTLFYVCGPLRGFGQLIEVRCMTSVNLAAVIHWGVGLSHSSAPTRANYEASTQIVQAGGFATAALPRRVHPMYWSSLRVPFEWSLPCGINLGGGSWFGVICLVSSTAVASSHVFTFVAEGGPDPGENGGGGTGA
jgi:hypothetical protein